MEHSKEFRAFVNCALDDETVRQNLSWLSPPSYRPSSGPIISEAVEAAVQRLFAPASSTSLLSRVKHSCSAQ